MSYHRTFIPRTAALLMVLLLAACSTSPVLYSPHKVDALAAQGDYWKAALAMKGIDTGPSSQPTALVILFDPNCPACAEQFEALRPYLHTVRIHWVPVGSTQGTLPVGARCTRVPPSLNLSATLLAQINARAALLQNQAGYDKQSCRGGYPASDHPLPWALRDAQSNFDDMALFKALGIPTLVYPTADGHGMHMGVAKGSTLRQIVQTAQQTQKTR